MDTGSASNEIQQYKFYTQAKVNQKLFTQEWNKAASNNDFFLLFTTDKAFDVKPFEQSGIIHGQNWTDYFGVFASRMFINADVNPMNINTATHTFLQLLVKAKDADEIVQKRPFANVEEAMEKTNIQERTLKRFRY